MQESILEQVQLLAEQGIRNGGSPVNVYRLQSALEGNHVIDREMVYGKKEEAPEVRMCPCECGMTFEEAVASLIESGDSREKAEAFLNDDSHWEGRKA